MSEEIKPKATDEVFCTSCGNIIKREAEICPKCGVRQQKKGFSGTSNTGEGKPWLTTLLLCIFLGWLGAHRFYTGHIISGICQIPLVWFFGAGVIWWLVDLILILCGNFKDADGNLLVR